MIRYKCTTYSRKSIVIKEGAYCLYYPRGATVKAPPHSLGIFVFATREDADKFMIARHGFVLKVQPIGKGTKPKNGLCGWDLRHFRSLKTAWRQYVRGIKARKDTNYRALPRGTVCYQAVKVLD